MEVIGKNGGITFLHNTEGDINVSINQRESSFPEKIPPMSNSTVDWAALYGLGKRIKTKPFTTNQDKQNAQGRNE